MLERRQESRHVRAHLPGRPLLACHVLRTEVDELVHARIGEFSIGVAPFTVVLVDGSVRLTAERRLLERHPAALADQLPRRAQKRVDRHVKEP